MSCRCCETRDTRVRSTIYNQTFMDPSRIAQLLRPFLRGSHEAESFELGVQQLQYISTYIDILLRWNARINLTAIRDPEEIVTRHFGESFFAARHLFTPCASVSPVVKGIEVADVGSGAGFPGIPLKLWAPEISLTLVESNHKKATFLREVTRTLTLMDINIQNSRAEALPPASFDVVTLRAVERFESTLPTAAALVKPQGRLALLIATPQLPQARSILSTYHCQDPQPIPNSRSRVLLIAERILGRSIQPS